MVLVLAANLIDSLASLTGDEQKAGRIAVKVINHLGDEVMKVVRGHFRHGGLL